MTRPGIPVIRPTQFESVTSLHSMESSFTSLAIALIPATGITFGSFTCLRATVMNVIPRIWQRRFTGDKRGAFLRDTPSAVLAMATGTNTSETQLRKGTTEITKSLELNRRLFPKKD